MNDYEYILLKIKKDFSEVEIMSKKTLECYIKEIEEVYRKMNLETDSEKYSKDRFSRYDYSKKTVRDISTHARIGG